MNIPAHVTVPTQAAAPVPEGTAGALPPVAAAAATPAAPAAQALPAGMPTQQPATATPVAAVPSAFNALLASLGLVTPAADGAAQETAEPADAEADATTTAVLPALPPGAPELPVPAAELTPAWRSDAAMLMASLPPAAAVQPGGAATPAGPTTAQPASTAVPALTPAQAAGASAAPPSTAALPVATPTGGAGAAGRVARAPVAERPQAQATLPASGPASTGALAAPSTLPVSTAQPPREAAALPADAATPPSARRDDANTAAWALPPADGASFAVEATTATAGTAAAAKPVPAHGQALLEALGERVQVQIAQRSEHAVIRLDPQAMGSVEIVLRHEGGALQVQLSASHPDVQRQLQGISEALRQDLSQRQYTDVSVNVAAQQHGDADGRRRQGGQPQPEQRPGQALAEAERGSTAGAFSLASSLE